MKSVLVADDSRTTQMLVKTTLARIPGLEVHAAYDGKEALRVLDERAIDLLVTDINMPEMDGIELVRRVRGGKAAPAVPILIITAKGEELARDQGMALGANGYLLKPISGRELVAAAARLLAGPTAA